MSKATETRLFLSVDISGSSKLKTSKNNIQIFTAYQSLMSIGRSILDATEKDIDEKQLSDIIFNKILTKNLDWLDTINELFEDFDKTFKNKLSTTHHDTIFPWKVLGDELIYSISVDSREDIHDILMQFYITLRSIDKNLKEKRAIRVKGSAWIASFPIRNKIIKVPSPELYYKDSDGNECPYLYPKEDYLGDEMDIGFRLGKCVFSGFMVVSMELAYLLGKVDSKSQFKIANVGWKELKGIWGGRCYPIYWISLPELDNLGESYNRYEYIEYAEWEVETNKFLRKWDKVKESLEEAKSFLEQISKIVEALPKSLGVVKPYLEGQDKIPLLHQDILKLMSSIRAQKESSIQQNNDNDVKKDEDDIELQSTYENFTENFIKD